MPQYLQRSAESLLHTATSNPEVEDWYLSMQTLKPDYFLDRKALVGAHRGASLSEQHNDSLCTKQDLSHTSRYVDAR